MYMYVCFCVGQPSETKGCYNPCPSRHYSVNKEGGFFKQLLLQLCSKIHFIIQLIEWNPNQLLYQAQYLFIVKQCLKSLFSHLLLCFCSPCFLLFAKLLLTLFINNNVSIHTKIQISILCHLFLGYYIHSFSRQVSPYLNP